MNANTKKNLTLFVIGFVACFAALVAHDKYQSKKAEKEAAALAEEN